MLFHGPQIFPRAGGTVVDHHHLFALLKEAFNQMRTDKSRPAGDQNMRRLTMEDGGWHRLKAEGGWRMEDGEWQRTSSFRVFTKIVGLLDGVVDHPTVDCQALSCSRCCTGVM